MFCLASLLKLIIEVETLVNCDELLHFDIFRNISKLLYTETIFVELNIII